MGMVGALLGKISNFKFMNIKKFFRWSLEWAIAIWVAILVAIIAFWVAVGYVFCHFLVKIW
jgi:hypothetical protein